MRAVVGFVLLMLGLGTMAVVMQEVGESQDLDRIAEAVARHGDWVADILGDLTPEQISRMLDIMDRLGIDAQEILLNLADDLAEDDMDTLLDVLEGLTPEQQEAFLEALAELHAGKDMSELTPEQLAALAYAARNYDGDPEDYERMMQGVQESGQQDGGQTEGGGQEPGSESGASQGTGAPLQGEATQTVITEYPQSVSKGSSFTVRGTVTSADGPVAGMPVRLYVNESKEAVGQRVGDGHTDADGEFAVEGMLPADMPLRPGVEYQFVAWGRPFISDDNAYAGSWSDPPFVIESETQIRVVGPSIAGPGQQLIQGWLEDSEGAPVQDAVVLVDGPSGRELHTDDQGRFWYFDDYSAGEHVIHFVFEGAEGMAGSSAQWEMTIQDRVLEGIPNPWTVVGDDVMLDLLLIHDGGTVANAQVTLIARHEGRDLREASWEFSSDDAGRIETELDLGRLPYGEAAWVAQDATGSLGSGVLWHQQEVETTVVSRYLVPNEPGAMWVQVTGPDGPVAGVEILVDGVALRTDADGSALIPAAGDEPIEAAIVESPAVVASTVTIQPEERHLPGLMADNGQLVMEVQDLDDGWRPYDPVLTIDGQTYDGTWSRGRLTFATELSPGRYDAELSGVYPDTVTSMSVQVPVPVPVDIPWLLIGGLAAAVLMAVGAWFGIQAIRRSTEQARDAPADILSWTVAGAPEGMPWFSDAEEGEPLTVNVRGDGKIRVRVGTVTKEASDGQAVFDALTPGQYPLTVWLRKGLRLHRSRGTLVRGTPEDALVRMFQLTASRFQPNARRPLSIGDLRRMVRTGWQDASALESLNVVEAIMYDGQHVSRAEAFEAAEHIRSLADG